MVSVRLSWTPLAKAGVEPRVVHESAKSRRSRPWSKQGLGLAGAQDGETLHGPPLTWKSRATDAPSRTLYMAWRKGAALSAAAVRFESLSSGESGMIHCVNLNATWEHGPACSDLKDGGVNKAFSALFFLSWRPRAITRHGLRRCWGPRLISCLLRGKRTSLRP